MTSPRTHTFEAVAFVENISLREIEPAYPEARRSPHALVWSPREGSAAFLFPFGAFVFQDLPSADQEAQIARLRDLREGLSGPVRREAITVQEGASGMGLREGILSLDHLTGERAGIIALTVAQSAAMEYYEGIIDDLLERTNVLVERLERRGTFPLRTSGLNRFIGEAVGTRNEVLSVLHLLDRPDAAWDDAGMDAIYDDLKDEFDLGDRFHAVEYKLRSIQESLELLLDVARDRRLVLLEAAIVVLIVGELLLSIVGHR